MEYQLLEHISLTEVDDEVVLLDLNSGAYYGLNHVGAMLLQKLRAGDTLNVAVQKISAHYQTDERKVKQDVDELLQQLLEQKLIRHSDSEQ